jgi:hypothetical protein
MMAKSSSKKKQAATKETIIEGVIEAIGVASEVVAEDDPKRASTIEFMAQSGKPIVRFSTGGGPRSYLTYDDRFKQEGIKVGTSFQLILRRQRGARRKINAEDVEAAIRQNKDGQLTQKAVANKLKVSESTLERWRVRAGINTWKEVIDRFTQEPSEFA